MTIKFKVGDYVTIKKHLSYTKWYHDKPMLIVSIDGIKVVRVDCVFNIGETNVTSNINDSYVELSKAHIRENKLDRILKEGNEREN